ncbi:PQQ-like beta-propeller repeat protein [Lacihabitans sp. LS3-19]|uniref:PQQ-like beta-propeller repeat protein n=1 Tax=Lacihabitans sp. LS3-19 TaxID=2487335 RepID=UPI0020CD66B5|nr:PQQ-like beta-propeller repeat protein [Lacihabitans sp. LS3-19]
MKELSITVNYLFEWNNYIHIGEYRFFNYLDLKEYRIKNIENISNLAPTFILKNKNSTLFKVVDLDIEKVIFFFLDDKFNLNVLDHRLINPRFLNDKFLVSLFRLNFSTFDVNTNSLTFQISLLELLDRDSIKHYGEIIEYQDKLFFSLYDDSKSGIYAIDAYTGKLVNHTNEIGGSMKLANGLLYINNDYTITTLNPDTFEITINNYQEVLKPFDLNIGILRGILDNVIVDNYFYFVSYAGETGIASVGILDLVKKDLVWHSEISIEEGSYWIKEIQVHDNKLFVLTQGGTLHIFEDLLIIQ